MYFIQRLTCTQKYTIGTSETVLIRERCPYFRLRYVRSTVESFNKVKYSLMLVAICVHRYVHVRS